MQHVGIGRCIRTNDSDGYFINKSIRVMDHPNPINPGDTVDRLVSILAPGLAKATIRGEFEFVKTYLQSDSEAIVNCRDQVITSWTNVLKRVL